MLIFSNSNKSFYLLFLFFMQSVSGFSQTTDTLAPYRDFISLCTGYQYAPLQLNIRHESSSNLILAPSDTLSAEGYFHIGDNGVSYFSMSNTEQYMDDSVLLMVNHLFKQVVMSADTLGARKRFEAYLGQVVSDTSLMGLAAQFTILPQSNSYTLDSRTSLPFTTIPRQRIQLLYDTQNRWPQQVLATRNMLVPIAPEDSTAFRNKYAGQDVLVDIPEIGLCFVRSYHSRFIYNHISHSPSALLPFNKSDYIRKNEAGEWELLPEKGEYRLTIE